MWLQAVLLLELEFCNCKVVLLLSLGLHGVMAFSPIRLKMAESLLEQTNKRGHDS